jgi:hypothetical protein
MQYTQENANIYIDVYMHVVIVMIIFSFIKSFSLKS